MQPTSNSPQPAAERWCIAVKREERSNVPSDWIEKLQNIEGVQITSDFSSRAAERQIVVFTATPRGLKLTQAVFGKICHIEPEILFELTTADGTLPPLPE